MAQPKDRGTDDEDALTILRRLEPLLTRVEERVQAVEAAQRRQDEHLSAIEQRLSRIEGALERVPNTWTIVSIMLALVAAVFAGMGVIAAIFA